MDLIRLDEDWLGCSTPAHAVEYTCIYVRYTHDRYIPTVVPTLTCHYEVLASFAEFTYVSVNRDI